MEVRASLPQPRQAYVKNGPRYFSSNFAIVLSCMLLTTPDEDETAPIEGVARGGGFPPNEPGNAERGGPGNPRPRAPGGRGHPVRPPRPPPHARGRARAANRRDSPVAPRSVARPRQHAGAGKCPSPLGWWRQELGSRQVRHLDAIEQIGGGRVVRRSGRRTARHESFKGKRVQRAVGNNEPAIASCQRPLERSDERVVQLVREPQVVGCARQVEASGEGRDEGPAQPLNESVSRVPRRREPDDLRAAVSQDYRSD